MTDNGKAKIDKLSGFFRIRFVFLSDNSAQIVNVISYGKVYMCDMLPHNVVWMCKKGLTFKLQINQMMIFFVY